MPSSPALRRVGWAAVAELQAGIISRRQLMELGLSRMQAKAYINNGRWQRMLPGVYATFTGPVGTFRRVWAAILYAGPGAAASHGTALWLWKVIDDPPTVIDVIVPELRKVLRQRGLRVHRRRALNQGLADLLIHHPSEQPPRLRVEEAMLDHCDSATALAAVDLVLRATQRRCTTAERFSRAIGKRRRQRWRSLLLEILARSAVMSAALSNHMHRTAPHRARPHVGRLPHRAAPGRPAPTRPAPTEEGADRRTPSRPSGPSR